MSTPQTSSTTLVYYTRQFFFERGDESIICLLIENGADFNTTDDFGNSVIYMAIRSNKSIVHFLFGLGVEVTCGAIDTAVRTGQDSIARFLTEKIESHHKSTASGVSKQIPAIELDLKHRLDLSDVEDSSEQDTLKPRKRMRLVNRPGED